MPRSGSAAEPRVYARTTYRLCFALAFLASLCFFALPTHAAQQASRTSNPLRFFFAGTGRLDLEHAHFGERLRVRYRNDDGSYDTSACEQIERFFRSRTDGRTQRIPLRLIELLAYLQNRYRAHPMVLLSGYRSPEFNDALGAQGQAVALASLHTQGLAADIALPTVDLRKLWLRLRAEKVGGIGLYQRQRFLHVDIGPPRFWEETTSRVSENLSAGNARIFARTDFDRYRSLTGSRISLHSVTALPVRVAPVVHADLPNGTLEAAIVPVTAGIVFEDGCWVIREPRPWYEFEVHNAEPFAAVPKGHRFAIHVLTCEPRVERTPPHVVTNAIELL